MSSSSSFSTESPASSRSRLIMSSISLSRSGRGVGSVTRKGSASRSEDSGAIVILLIDRFTASPNAGANVCSILSSSEVSDWAIQGTNFNSSGKRIDALMKTRGIIESFSFVEIKTHKTRLLKSLSKAYRSESWQISDELTGAIAQVQRTVQKAITQITNKVEIKDAFGNPTGEKIYLYNPKSYIVIGGLSEFESEYGVNDDKYSSFELFRQGLSKIDILTYDELYERASNIVKSSETTFLDGQH